MPKKRPQRHKKEKQSSSEDRFPGTVITRFGAALDVEDENGVHRRCTSRRKLTDIVCGDRVIWQPVSETKGVVVERLERTSLLSRPDDRGREKKLAANINQIIVVSVVKGQKKDGYNLNHRLIDHYLVAAEAQDISPVLVINKIDLLNEADFKQLDDDLKPYRDIGYTVLHTSTKSNNGMTPLIEQLQDRTSVFVGESGVGKSSLINTLLPEVDIRVGEISALSSKGKHTTTTTVLYHLASGGDLIDSPGVREFGLMLNTQTALAHGFKEFRNYMGLCKFNNCSHQHEPSCAIIDAVEKKEIKSRRYASYRKMLETQGENNKIG